MTGYMLFVDDKPTQPAESFAEAKSVATPYLNSGKALRIESFIAPAPSQIWNYDSTIAQWVEHVRGS